MLHKVLNMVHMVVTHGREPNENSVFSIDPSFEELDSRLVNGPSRVDFLLNVEGIKVRMSIKAQQLVVPIDMEAVGLIRIVVVNDNNS